MRRRSRHNDEGAALILAIALVVVGALMVGGLATQSTANLRTLPIIRERTNVSEGLKAAIRIAINMQRDTGPERCFQTSMNLSLNGEQVSLTCTPGLPVFARGERFGVISTSNSAAAANVAGAATGYVRDIEGRILLNAGRLTGNTNTLRPQGEITLSSFSSTASVATRYGAPSSVTPFACNDTVTYPGLVASDTFARGTNNAGVPADHSLNCQSGAWWTFVGDADQVGQRTYPPLPPIPSYQRTGHASTAPGGCKVLFPGQYLGSDVLRINGGTWYFTSGVYYFERPIQIEGGATVIIGAGPVATRGCVTDLTASRLGGAPRTPEITGRGATLIFGGAGKLTISGSSTKVTFNRRSSSSANRGSEGISIRTVSHGTATAALEVPQDEVLLPDGTLVNVSTYEVAATATSLRSVYRATTITPTTPVLRYTVGSSSRLIVPGYVLTPHGQLVIDGTSSGFTAKLSGGVVASQVLLPFTGSPATAGFTLGSVPEVAQRQFSLTATSTIGGRAVSSSAQLEVSINNTYALNSWTVDP